MGPGEQPSVMTGILGADFVHFAGTLSDVLEALSQAPQAQYSLHPARDRITQAVSALAGGGAIPERAAQELSALIVEIFGRPSTADPQFTVEAVRALFMEIYATVQDFMNDPDLFQGLPPAVDQFYVRGAVVSMFWPIFSESEATTLATPILLDAAVKKVRLRILRATQQLEDLQKSIASGKPVASVMMAPDLPDVALPWMACAIFTQDSAVPRTGEVEITVPPVETVGFGDRIRRVWYGTSRAPVAPTDEAQGFTNQLDTKLHYGYCHIFVPRNHEVGTVKTSWIRRLIAVSAGESMTF